jgi:hypothetical protein
VTAVSESVQRTPFTCSGCGGQFFDRHSCPHMPWGNTAPGPILVPIQSWPRVWTAAVTFPPSTAFRLVVDVRDRDVGG